MLHGLLPVLGVWLRASHTHSKCYTPEPSPAQPPNFNSTVVCGHWNLQLSNMGNKDYCIFLLFYIYLFCVCLNTYESHRTIWNQFFPPRGFCRDWTLVIKFGSNHLICWAISHTLTKYSWKKKKCVSLSCRIWILSFISAKTSPSL